MLCNYIWLIALVLFLNGCSTLSYYSQSVSGHLALMADSRPISEILIDSGTSPTLKSKLDKVLEIRDYSVTALKLPDNQSYRGYASLDREAAVWSVVATPEFSTQPKQWCYLVIGCASYRGYFSKASAERYIAELQQDGFDVALQPVPAYSTLGWFADPLPSTVINWPVSRIAGLVFHELAHQKNYVPGDSAFNEAYANAVQQYGVERWLKYHEKSVELERWQRYLQRRKAFIELLMKARRKLKQLYAREFDEQKLRRTKVRVFNQLHADYQLLKESWDGYAGYDRWFDRKLNNAHLASVATYEHWLPAFQKMLADAPNIDAFHRQCDDLAGMNKAERTKILEHLLWQDARGDGHLSTPAQIK